jgi:hypothetical protein
MPSMHIVHALYMYRCPAAPRPDLAAMYGLRAGKGAQPRAKQSCEVEVLVLCDRLYRALES